MAMMDCRHCGKPIDTSAFTCPHCGGLHPAGSRTNGIRLAVWLAFGLMVLFVAMIICATAK